MEPITEANPELVYTCDFCARTAEGDAWPLCPRIRKHFCPACLNRHKCHVPPRLATAEEAMTWHKRDNTGW